ncbi:MAG: hypothetical protein L0241_19915 [Planctomycetia bacterium]|nr:hypothetical protein [Planctomycetia bacterium]
MAKSLLGAVDGDSGTGIPTVPPAPPPPDPRIATPTPVEWQTQSDLDAPARPESSEDVLVGLELDELSPPRSLWKKLKRNLLFWRQTPDWIQVSVFAPPVVTPGQSVKLTVYLHTPEAAASVRTLSRAIYHDAELIGTGLVSCEVTRKTELAAHLSVANAGVARSMIPCVWHGQPHRLAFSVHVPWESPEGPAPCVMSIGVENVRIGKIEFWLHVLPRKA